MTTSPRKDITNDILSAMQRSTEIDACIIDGYQ